jgi:uncharacterized repeat protein (TIGR01451 family)
LAVCVGVAAAALHKRPALLVRDEKVTICHATSSEHNPYVQEQVDHEAVVKPEGHAHHPEDIIPPFDYDDHGETKHFGGLNWDAAGIAIWAKGCEVQPPAPTPLPVQPIVKCVDADGGSFTAIFGYSSPNPTAVTVTVGAGNSFSPDPSDRGQPTTFQPGTVESAVTVTGTTGSTIVWSVTVGGKTSSASATATFPTACSITPPPGPSAIEISVKCVDSAGGSFDATFAYANSASSVVTIQGGTSNNSLSPALATPPSTFQPGSGEFTVTGIPNGTSLTWTLVTDQTRTATATASSTPACTTPPGPQPITVSVTCVQDHGSTFDATFGYVNANGAPVDIPAGPDNQVTVRIARSSAQPTTFQPGTVTNAFTATNVPAGADVEWSVTYAGATSVATANEAVPTHCGVDPPDPPGAYRIGIFVDCVTNTGDTYSATFGYESEDTETTTVAVGDRNRFFPEPQDQGQPTTFDPGHVQQAFTVSNIPVGQTLVWSVTSDAARFAEATASFEEKCSSTPPPEELLPIGVFVTCVTNHGGTYDAVFGYTNDNVAQQIIPLGLSNTFAPAPGNRGQPTTFEPGTVRNAVTVRGIRDGTLLVWRVELEGARWAIASDAWPQKCSQPPVPPQPPDPGPPPPDPKPPESGLFATCVLHEGAPTTYDAVFGYANGNQDDVIIPVGRRNLVAPAPLDRGQPSVFTPGIVLNAFTVTDVPRTQDLTWALTLPGGDTRTATASARFPRNCILAPAPQTADLVLTKTIDKAQLTAGQRGTYRIHVYNRGPSIALQVSIVDDVDPRLELLSASTNRGSCSTSGQRVSCTIAALPPGARVTVVVAVRARGAGTVRNVATARHAGVDPTPGNNVGSATIVVTGRAGGVSPAFTG